MSDINVTPFVDVMLVLLVIFMVTAPMLQQGIDVNLPEARAGRLPKDESQITIFMNKKKEIFINRDKMNLKNLDERLKKIARERTGVNVYLRADKDLPYGFVIKVMAKIRESGIQNLGMITEPEHIPIQ